MRKPKETSINYGDLLTIISALKTEAKGYKNVEMNKEAQEIMDLREKFQKIKKNTSLNITIIH